ncbi:MAG: UDP-N-acetylmuramoyl-tripeptide--D-alanyl-D-alanine ligase [Planctomycetota bacterium]
MKPGTLGLEDLLEARSLAGLLGGELVGAGSARGLGTDTRSLRDGELFVALRGERFDGHDHVPAALAAGASGLLVERLPDTLPPGTFAVRVADTRAALGRVAAAWRRSLDLRVAAITGSCGKTTTKEFARQLLAPRLSMVASERSFNNDVGLPLTLLRCRPTTELALVELGTNHPGEIGGLAAIAAPDVAAITRIGRAHLEGLGDIAGVLEEKGSLLDALPAGGTAVLDRDSAHHDALAARALAAVGAAGRVLGFGLDPRADLRAEELRREPAGIRFRLRFLRGDAEVAVPMLMPRHGLHDLRNLLCALGLARALGFDPEELVDDCATLSGPPRRLEVRPGPRGSTVLDDSYNANPDSLLAALQVLDTWPGARRRLLVLGDLLELGDAAPAIHRDLGSEVLCRVDALFAVGPLAACAAGAEVEGRRPAVVLCDDGLDALEPLLAELGEDDVVLVKGSRRLALDRLVDALVAAADRPVDAQDRDRAMSG